MTLSPETIAILRNFATISPSIIVTPGNVLKTRTQAVYAEATVSENFPVEFGISDLAAFVRSVALFKQPVLDFTAEYVQITEADGNAGTQYVYAKPGSISALPTKRKNVEAPAECIVCTISDCEWATLRKALGIGAVRKRWDNAPKCLKITSDGTAVRVAVACRYTTPIAEEYWLKVSGQPQGLECNMLYANHTLTMLDGSYDISVTQHYSQFKHRSGYDLLYLVAPEPLSTWGGKKSYRVKVTKSTIHDGFLFVDAHSPEEAEALARQKADDELRWTAEARLEKVCSVV
jgi:hypothetical protein